MCCLYAVTASLCEIFFCTFQTLFTWSSTILVAGAGFGVGRSNFGITVQPGIRRLQTSDVGEACTGIRQTQEAQPESRRS